jgi:uncharacterized membrane protein YozB (DUF420 family)
VRGGTIAWIGIGAAVVAGAVLALFEIGRPEPPPGPLPRLVLRDGAGARCNLASLDGRVWVGSFLPGRCLLECPQAIDALARIRDRLPAEIPLVTFVVDGRGLWPARPAAVSERRGWMLCQGNDVDADSDGAVRALAADRFDAGPDVAGQRDAWVAAVDRTGRARKPQVLGTDADAIAARAVFLRSLESRPALHATLNGISAALLLTGFTFIRRRAIAAHLACMAAATGTTLVFLVSYLQYHAYAGSVPFSGGGVARPIYLAVLISHTVLASLVVPMALALLWWAARRRFDRHRALARWTFPVWLYVSCTGVLIYFMLYVWFAD